MIAGLALVPAGLLALVGPPRLPAVAPAWGDATALGGAQLIGLAATVAWALWAWAALSLVLQLVVVAARVVGPAAWVGPLATIVDRLSAPLIREVVRRSLLVVLVANVVGRAAPPPAHVALALDGPTDPGAVGHRTEGGDPGGGAAVRYDRATGVVATAPLAADGLLRQASEPTRHIVSPGETLHEISRQHYGVPDEWPRLAEATRRTSVRARRRAGPTSMLDGAWARAISVSRIHNVRNVSTPPGRSPRLPASTERSPSSIPIDGPRQRVHAQPESSDERVGRKYDRR